MSFKRINNELNQVDTLKILCDGLNGISYPDGCKINGMILNKLTRIFKAVKPEIINSALKQEIILIMFVSIVLLIIAQQVDAFEMLVKFVVQYETYEIITLVLVLSFAFLLIAIRNVKYLQAEVKLRLASEAQITRLFFLIH